MSFWFFESHELGSRVDLIYANRQIPAMTGLRKGELCRTFRLEVGLVTQKCFDTPNNFDAGLLGHGSAETAAASFIEQLNRDFLHSEQKHADLWLALANLAGGLETIHAWHSEIEHH